MRKQLETIKANGKKTTILGLLVMVIGALIAFSGNETVKEADKALMILDSGKLDQVRLK